MKVTVAVLQTDQITPLLMHFETKRISLFVNEMVDRGGIWVNEECTDFIPIHRITRVWATQT
jgi:hypothetical protein